MLNLWYHKLGWNATHKRTVPKGSRGNAPGRRWPPFLSTSFRLPIFPRLCSLMHAPKAPLHGAQLCGQAVHNHAYISVKPGKWRNLSVHRKVIHRVWTLWMVFRPKEGQLLFWAACLHKRQILCIAYRPAQALPPVFWAGRGTPPQGCGCFGAFIHMLYQRQNAGDNRV